MIHYMPDAPGRQKRRCLIVISHSLNEVTLARFQQCQAELASTFDVFLVLSEPLQGEVQKHGLQNVVCLTRDQIFPPEYGRKSATFSIKPGNADLILLAFWQQHPGYEYYWVMEFDVYTPRGLAQLAMLDQGSEADLLGTYIRLRRHHANWDNWGSLEAGPSRVEGVDVDMVATACFLPLSRYSARLLDALDWSYQHGWIGHHEATIATVAACNGMKLEDLNTLAKRVLGRQVYNSTCFNHEKSVAADPLFFHHPIKHLSQIEALDGMVDSPAAALSPQ
jgi:hypothetical protein